MLIECYQLFICEATMNEIEGSNLKRIEKFIASSVSTNNILPLQLWKQYRQTKLKSELLERQASEIKSIYQSKARSEKNNLTIGLKNYRMFLKPLKNSC